MPGTVLTLTEKRLDIAFFNRVQTLTIQFTKEASHCCRRKHIFLGKGKEGKGREGKGRERKERKGKEEKERKGRKGKELKELNELKERERKGTKRK